MANIIKKSLNKAKRIKDEVPYERKQYFSELKPAIGQMKAISDTYKQDRKARFNGIGIGRSGVQNAEGRIRITDGVRFKSFMLKRVLVPVSFLCLFYMLIMLLFTLVTDTESELFVGFSEIFYAYGPFFLLASIAVVFFSALYEGTSLYALSALTLTYVGFMLQVCSVQFKKNYFFNGQTIAYTVDQQLQNGEKIAKNTVVFFVIAIAVGTIGKYLIALLGGENVKRHGFHFCNIVCLLLFGILRALPNTNNAYCWIKIGNYSLQVTEIIKLLAIVALVLLFTCKDERLTKKREALALTTFLLLHIVGFALLNEFGTFLIIFLVAIFLIIIFKKINKETLKGAAVILLAGVLIFGAFYGCHTYYKSHVYSSYTQTQELKGDEKLMSEKEVPMLISLGENYYSKIEKRVNGFINQDKLDPYGDGYQQDRALKGLLKVTLLGNNEQNYIPEGDSDFVFMYLIMCLGLIPSFFVIAIVLIMNLKVLPMSLNVPHSTEGAIAFALNLSLIIQFLLSAASGSLMIVTIGVTLPFIGRSGTLLCYCYTVVIYTIYALRLKRVKEKAPEPVEIIERVEPEITIDDDIDEQSFFDVPKAHSVPTEEDFEEIDKFLNSFKLNN